MLAVAVTGALGRHKRLFVGDVTMLARINQVSNERL